MEAIGVDTGGTDHRVHSGQPHGVDGGRDHEWFVVPNRALVGGVGSVRAVFETGDQRTPAVAVELP